jgi:signal transduction histidine kinase
MIRNKTLLLTNLIFFGASLLLVVLTFFSYQRINKQIRASNEVSQTQLVKFKLNDAFSHLLKSETAQRGFILTGDSSFFYDFFFAKEEIPRILSEVRLIITESDRQRNNLRRATQLFQARLRYMHTTLLSKDNISNEQLDSLLIKGKYITDSLNQQIEQMISVEDQSLRQRMVVKQNEERDTSIFILLFSFLSVCILLIGFFRVKTEMFNNSVLEKKVKQRTEEIRIANEILNQQNLQLKHKNDELSSFTFVANHDLKEPLRKIELLASKMGASSDTISIEHQDLLAKIIESVRRMKDLLEDIFVYTLTDKIIRHEITDLNKVVAISIENFKEMIHEKAAIVEYGKLPLVYAVPEHMEKLFTNLVSNALKYSKTDVAPHIKIEAKQENEMQRIFWRIEVSDNGIGFKGVYREKIFEMFQRLHPNHQYYGTGMGLTICKKIVENHGGTITANSKEGEGSVFTILLPVQELKNEIM